MAKGKSSVFFCQNCGYESPKWMGQCPGCREWNTFAEEPVQVSKGSKAAGGRRLGSAQVQKLTEVKIEESKRTGTGIGELDRVLGGGIVTGSLVLVGGDPGIGKSTLLLQVCRNLTQAGKHVLYISGEESPAQIRMRADRMGTFNDNLFLLCETNLDTIRETIETMKPDMVVIDSIQTMYNDTVTSAPGSVSQVRESTGALMQIAKGLGVTIFIVGHVTKEGVVAGPRVLEHMVDTVLYFEGDRSAAYRILRAAKNRFGSTNEIGVFEMQEAGLREVTNPSEYMLEGRPEHASGCVVACSMEGTRPILIDVQALVCRSNLAYPRRTADGADLNRVNLLLAVLEKRLGLHLSGCDAYVNIAGGMKLREPAVDLGIVVAIISSYKDIVLSDQVLVFGEVGLSGEIRSVSMARQRVAEAKKLGFAQVIMPEASRKAVGKVDGLDIAYVKNVRELYGAMARIGSAAARPESADEEY